MPFRIAAVVLVLFFFGHTFGGMWSQPSMGPASDVVFKSMKAVPSPLSAFTYTLRKRMPETFSSPTAIGAGLYGRVTR